MEKRNRKPNFASIGKCDDPKKKSAGGHFVLLRFRPWEEDTCAIFNFNPGDIFYCKDRFSKNSYPEIVTRHETNWKFLEGHK